MSKCTTEVVQFRLTHFNTIGSVTHDVRPSVRGTATAGCRGASFGKVENLFQPQSLSAWLKSRWHHKKRTKLIYSAL